MNHKESFLQYLQTERRYSPHTVRSYSNDLSQFIVFHTNDETEFNPGTVISQDVRDWIVSLLDSGISPSSVHRKISCLRVFFRFLRKEGLHGADPMEKVVMPKRRKRLPGFVPESSLDTLLDSCDFGD
ncbi:MAG: hypothetical protein FJY11_06890, partial [Bacteroidetes bacterium]|nr:hypothetical protein [Bacteroidota bacterium]